MWGSHATEKNSPPDVFTRRNSVLLGAIGSARQALLKVGWGKGVVSPQDSASLQVCPDSSVVYLLPTLFHTRY